MPRIRRSAARKAPIIESSSDSEDDVPLKKPRPSEECKPKTKDNKAGSDSSSESDIENYLQPVDKIDLNSEFFKPQKNDKDDFSKIEKNIFVGVTRLSDSSDSDAEMEELKPSSVEKSLEKKEELPESSQSSTSVSKINFKQLDEYTRKIEEAKKQVEKYNKKKKQVDSKMDISKLLKAGESKQITLENIKESDLHPSDFESSDEDWEEVKIKDSQEQKDKPIISKQGLQIMVDVMPDSMKKKKEVDLLAAMKRRLNRIRKENQVYIHKVHLLCWIAHGNYVNSVLNNTNILGMALSLLPSDKCYPSDRVDLSYLEQIVQWFRRTVKLAESDSTHDLQLSNALQLQIGRKEAFNKKMLVLIFIVIMRALGIQCRLVMSLLVEPLRPPAHELHSLAKESNSKKTSKDMKKNKNGGPSPAKATPYRRDVKVEQAKEAMKARESKKKPVQEKHVENEKGKLNSENTKRSKAASLKNGKNADSAKQQQTASDKGKSSKVSSKSSVADKKSNIGKDKSGTNNNRPIKSQSESKSQSRRSTRSKKGENQEVPQLDGADDSSDDDFMPSPKKFVQLDGSRESSSPGVSKKPNLHKLKDSKVKVVKKNNVSKKPSLGRLQSNSKNKSEETTPKRVSLPTKKQATTPLGSKSRTSIPAAGKQFDVKNDIINLIKGRISEQKQIDRSRLVKKRKPVYEEDSSESDSDYMPEPIKKKDHDSDIEYFVPKPKVKKRIKVKKDPETGKNIVFSDSDLDGLGKKRKKGIDVWVEVFLEAEEKWIAADIAKGQVHCVNEIYTRATHPVSYVIAWNNNNTLKDVTRRYCKNFNTVTRKLRTDPKWWEETLNPFMGKQTARDREEENDLNRQQLDQPMPKSIAEYKNHPLYALKRHLLKFEAIYPPNVNPLGFVRSEAVYPRNCVYVCKSRDIWLKEAKVVKPGEKPYKIVKARPKWDKLSNKVINDQLLEIFGEWQTMDYDPPTAENGIVPRNAFGNVELFKACMLPKGTVHLKLPGLNKICRKLNVDCASAIVGFDFHGGWSHPTYDGFVICKEYEDQVVAAWELDQEESEKREADKLEKRVFDNWKKLIKGMLIKQKLKAKYNFGETSEDKKTKSGGNKKTE